MLRVKSYRVNVVGVCLAGLLAGTGFVSSVAAKDEVRQSVVKVHATMRPPDFVRPWAKANARDGSGTGFVLDGNRVLTNWHVVEYASQIFVQLDQSTEKLAAEVEYAAPGLDMALLKLEDDADLADVPSLPIAESLPQVRETVNVYGYPVGGDDLSVTEGIISRIEFVTYNLDAFGLRIQVDAPLNPGNSGGPAVIGGKVVGLVFSKMNQAENIGYLIPAEELNTFLSDIKDGKYDGKQMLYDTFQETENESLRKKLKLPDDGGGVLVRDPYDAENGLFQVNDVITHIEDQEIDSQGNVRVSDELRLDFRYAVTTQCTDRQIKVKLIRDGEPLELSVPTLAKRDWLIPPLYGEYPRYFILGPMVFTVGTQDFLQALGVKGVIYLSSVNSPLVLRRLDRPSSEGEELVMLANAMLPHRMIKGYNNRPFGVVKSVNGEDVRNLRHLIELLRDCKEPFLTFEFEGEHERIILSRSEMIGATEDILADGGIRYQFSRDLRGVWEFDE